jgi:hypothetical protein
LEEVKPEFVRSKTYGGMGWVVRKVNAFVWLGVGERTNTAVGEDAGVISSEDFVHYLITNVVGNSRLPVAGFFFRVRIYFHGVMVPNLRVKGEKENSRDMWCVGMAYSGRYFPTTK